ncbi:unnamed protein product [marine sediment metagenome]|uniref:Uncharacterized protein n=1 Tax=marine sediment metagenome TaxID=412755 RepID=X0RU99_9ZZZZ
MGKRSTKILALTIVASIAFSLSIALFIKAKPLPAWIIAEKIISEKLPEKYVEINEEDVSMFPQLAEAIQNADDARWVSPITGLATEISPSGPMLKMDHESGRTLLELLGGDYQNKIKTYNFTIRVNNNYYTLEMLFSNEPSKRA